ncbi:NADPH-dependent FMN reductase [Pseudorhodoferax sp. Leaf274]|uniref:NADPH-dependent FMN reductase n=1 Tax=Pseudorhodoferax sp. Leaf274 TaxID=1736318 RepID=UPI000702E5CA|nr:NAD(P)H-dependent oxidoreductase [Pseudorhodoferax sp. Leaf274]KQP38912.1 NADPH-dependent FMN reductase [Pseudorhodoferax sp. Leaf274]
MSARRLLVIPASARTGSLNVRLARHAARTAEGAGWQAQLLDLRTLALPVYDGDLEAAEGVPAGALALQQAVADSAAVLVVTPEYNGFPTPLFVNAFDWLSRIQASDGRAAGLATTADKPVGLLSASPGPLGGLRAMNFVRQYLQMAFAMLVVPQQFALGRANEAFDAEGALADARAAQSVARVLDALARLVPSGR